MVAQSATCSPYFGDLFARGGSGDGNGNGNGNGKKSNGLLCPIGATAAFLVLSGRAEPLDDFDFAGRNEGEAVVFRSGGSGGGSKEEGEEEKKARIAVETAGLKMRLAMARLERAAEAAEARGVSFRLLLEASAIELALFLVALFLVSRDLDDLTPPRAHQDAAKKEAARLYRANNKKSSAKIRDMMRRYKAAEKEAERLRGKSANLRASLDVIRSAETATLVVSLVLVLVLVLALALACCVGLVSPDPIPFNPTA